MKIIELPQNDNDYELSEELIAKVIEVEAYMRLHPNEWVTSEELFKKLEKFNNHSHNNILLSTKI